MNETPRLRSSYPVTPRKRPNDGPSVPFTIKAQSPPSSPPLIPLHIIDAPSQRLYIAAIWVISLGLRLYDWASLMERQEESIWLFSKFVFIDALLIYTIPKLRIPWMEWSTQTQNLMFISHAIINAMLMFRIPLPLESSLIFFTRALFDKEMAVSEHNVRPASILNNASLIMGKQIINILPEGSAVLNPDHWSFCIDNEHTSVRLPFYFNETTPRRIELLRIDLDSNQQEIIDISKVEKKLAKHPDETTLKTYHHTVKKTGLYRLNKVVDSLDLEVQRKWSDALIVKCPKATVKSTSKDRCLGDLSEMTMELEGTPPLKIVYSRTINQEDRSFHFQRNQPDGFTSPLISSSAITSLASAEDEDVSWARSYRVIIPLNESMTTSGEWLYSVDEIHDAAGNFANYSSRGQEGEHIYPRGTHLEQSFHVHERPVASFTKCDFRTPLMVALGQSTQLPVSYKTSGRMPDDTAHSITYKFSPLESLTAAGEHGEQAMNYDHYAKNARNLPVIKRSGLYTLMSVKSQFCEGEIQEPASCLLLSPPVPELSISAQDIYDKCAGNSIGLLVNLDLIGTPPFNVAYEITTRSGTRLLHRKIEGLRDQLELRPSEAGVHKYKFVSVSDSVYSTPQRLGGKGMLLEQSVKPPAFALIRRLYDASSACIEEPVSFSVELFGEKPFALEYELVHGGKRKKESITDIDTDHMPITTDPLFEGGQYTLVLASVQDKSGCKVSLNEGLNFTVRHQRPKASFGQLDGKFKVMALEGSQVSLPLRLTGRSPWLVQYRNKDDPSGKIVQQDLYSANDHIRVQQRGTYELIEVSDDQCPGTVDSNSAEFHIDWVPRPRLELADKGVEVQQGHQYSKREVCEGDIDSFDIKLIGSPPYHVKYTTRHMSTQGSSTIRAKSFDAGLNKATIPMDTSKAGYVEYIFSELSDDQYDYDPKKMDGVSLRQTVNRKPAAYFSSPGKSYKYCKEEVTGTEVISITLEGVAPFYLEVEIKHQNSVRPETLTIPNIESDQYDLRIPHRVLSLGIHQVSIRKVRDAKGCQQKTEFKAPSVQVQVFDVPTISPLESRENYCVGDRITYTLSGQAPFEIDYTFQGSKKNAKSSTTNFKRIAEKPGIFTITAVSDKASSCKANTQVTKIIHELPSVKISKGTNKQVDIHEGSSVEILFEFWGTPPFEFTYTRSTNAKKGQKSEVLETRHDVSHESSKTIISSLEGTYEVVSIKDKFCGFSTSKVQQAGAQKLLQF